MKKWQKINNEEIDDRYIISKDGVVKDTITNFTYISKSNNHKGYIQLSLMCKNNKRKKFLLHRLVAQTFIPNPNNYPIINHIDENKQNNSVDNLEWCTQQHNMKCWARNRKGGSYGKQKNV